MLDTGPTALLTEGIVSGIDCASTSVLLISIQ